MSTQLQEELDICEVGLEHAYAEVLKWIDRHTNEQFEDAMLMLIDQEETDREDVGHTMTRQERIQITGLMVRLGCLAFTHTTLLTKIREEM